jgi:hypothetical protein
MHGGLAEMESAAVFASSADSALKHLIVYSLRYCQNINATQDKEASVKKKIGRTPLQILGRRIASA